PARPRISSGATRKVGRKASPAPVAKIRAAQRWLFLPSPAGGGTPRRSEAQTRRGGAVPQAPISREEGPHPGSLRSPTLPLQGRVKKEELCERPVNNCAQSFARST